MVRTMILYDWRACDLVVVVHLGKGCGLTRCVLLLVQKHPWSSQILFDGSRVLVEEAKQTRRHPLSNSMDENGYNIVSICRHLFLSHAI